jgi:tripartite-type tricarboxylate transporter receptor subunit TctC
MITRRVLLSATATLAASSVAHAQEGFPSRPIQIVVPYSPGNAIDILARGLAVGLAAQFPQPVVVLNREGAAGAVGSSSVARAAPDGHTLLFVPALVASVLPVTQPASGLRVETFRPVCQAFNNTMALVVRPDSQLRDLRALHAAAQARPGQLTFGSLGVASIPHLAVAQWMGVAGAQLEHVPFRGDPQVMTEVLAGRIDVGAIVLGSAAGRNDLRILTVFDARRHRDFPDTPTAMEQGFDVAPASFGGIFVPSATPDDRVARLEAACAAAAASETYRTALRAGSQPDDVHLGSADFARRLQDDVERKGVLLRGMTLN